MQGSYRFIPMEVDHSDHRGAVDVQRFSGLLYLPWQEAWRREEGRSRWLGTSCRTWQRWAGCTIHAPKEWCSFACTGSGERPVDSCKAIARWPEDCERPAKLWWQSVPEGQLWSLRCSPGWFVPWVPWFVQKWSCLNLAPSTTLYYKACTNYFPVLLCTTKLAQTTSQYYFALQSLHKLLPSTTLYYKACTKHFPVLLCTTKLAQTTSQYYIVLQSLHKTLPSTTVTKQP